MSILKRISLAALCVILSVTFTACSIFPTTTTVKPTTTEQTTTSPTEQITTGTVINAPGTVNIRSEPNSNCVILGTVNDGEVFVVLKAFYSPSWHQIEYDGRTAYIFKDYFQINDSSVIVATESSASASNPTTTVTATTGEQTTEYVPPTSSNGTTTATPTTSVKPTTTIAPTTSIKPTTTASPTTTVESSANGYIVRNRAQLLEMIRITLSKMEPEILLDISYCTDKSYSGTGMNSIISEAEAVIEEETGIDDIIRSWEYPDYSSEKMTVTFEYSYSKTQLDLTKSKAESIVNNILSGKPTMSDYEKELAIHDYIVNNTVYDQRYYSNKTEPAESHSAYGSLVLGKAVCEGYAEAMNLLCYLADIECLNVVGYGSGESHAWNIVYIDDAYYQVDATWDDPTGDDGTQTLKHTYFNITDAKMLMLNHSWVAADYPKCVSTTCNYYYMKNLVVKNIDELKSRLRNMISNKQSGIELLLEGYTSASYQNIKDAIYNTIYAKGSTATYYWWWIEGSGVITVYGIEYK